MTCRDLSKCALFVLALQFQGLSQTTGMIEGTVCDPDHRPVSGGEITLVETTTNAARKAQSDVQGRYDAPGLTPGTYRVKISVPGFRTVEQPDVTLSAGRTVRIDFLLEIGALTETVTVTGKESLVGTSSSDWGGTVSRQQLDALPLNGRDLFDLVSQESGVSVTKNSGGQIYNGLGIQISVNGSRPNQNSFRMDGVYLNDGAGSAPASAAGRLLGVEGIQELRLITSPFSAEYGKAAGGVLTAVSRGGSNAFHGVLYEYLRNSAFDARNFFDSPGGKAPPMRRNQFGGLLSGPVKSDRVFFLLNYEGVREASGSTRRAVTLDDNARKGILPSGQVAVNPAVTPYLSLYPKANGRDFGDGSAEFISQGFVKTREDYGAARGDFLFSDRLRTSVHFTADDADNNVPDLFLVWNLQKYSRFAFVHSETTFVQTPRMLHSFRFGYSHVGNNEVAAPPAIPAALSFVPGRPIGQIQVTGLTDFTERAAGSVPRYQVLDDDQFSYQLSYVHAGHTFKAGAAYDLLGFHQRADLNANGRYIFSSIQNLLQGITRSGDLMSPASDTKRVWRQHQYSFFAQDEFRPWTSLSATAGIRYEGYTTPTEADNKIATLPDPMHDTRLTIGGPLFANPSAANFAPRAAIAWNPSRSPHTVVRAGAGVFFDLLTSSDVTIAGMRVPPFYNRLFVTAPAFPGLLAASQAVPPDPSMDSLAYDLRQPYVLHLQFSIARQAGQNTELEIGYSGSRGIHLMGQFGDLNISQPQTLADGRQFFTQGAPFRNPSFARIGMRRTDFDSSYEGLVARVRHRFSAGVSFQANYTWAKSIDNSSTVANADFVTTDRNPFPLNVRLQRGLSDFDVRHAVNANVTWDPPWQTRGWTNHFLGGWEVNGLGQLQTGFPFNPRVGFDRARLQSGYGDLDQRPNLAPTAASGAIVLGDPAKYFDPSAFTLPDAGFYGNLGRNTLPGPGLFSLNLSVNKLIWQSERTKVRLRADSFNATNHPNFQAPAGLALFSSTGARVGSAGQITTTSTPSRQLQLALRVTF